MWRREDARGGDRRRNYLPSRYAEGWATPIGRTAYLSASMHTGYEAVERSGLFLYRQYGTAAVALFVLHGIDFDTTGELQPTATVSMTITGVPAAAGILLSDDGGEFGEFGGDFAGNWWFSGNTDGGVIAGIPIPDDWTLTDTPDWGDGLTEWVYVDGDDSLLPLDMDEAVEIRAHDSPSPCRTDCTIPACGDGILDGGELPSTRPDV